MSETGEITPTSSGSETGSGPPPQASVITVDDHLDIPAKEPVGSGVDTTSEKPSKQTKTAEVVADATTDTPPVAQPVALSADIVHQLAEARLKPIQGEDDAAALRRLNRHYSGLSRKHFSSVKNLEEQVGRLTAIAESNARAEWEKIQQAQRERAMASMPDPEVEPEKYNRLLAEETLRRLTERERVEAERQAEEQRLSQVLDVDEQAFDALESEINSDPEAAAAYQFATDSGLQYVRTLYPDAPDDKVYELVQLVQQNEIRMHHARGMSYLDTARANMHAALNFAQRYGYMPQPQQVQQAQAPQPVVQPQPQQANGNKGGSPTAQRLQAESAKAQARQAVSPSGSRPSAVPSNNGQIDLNSFESEEDYVRARLSGAITDSDYDRLATAQLGRGRRG